MNEKKYTFNRDEKIAFYILWFVKLFVLISISIFFLLGTFYFMSVLFFMLFLISVYQMLKEPNIIKHSNNSLIFISNISETIIHINELKKIGIKKLNKDILFFKTSKRKIITYNYYDELSDLFNNILEKNPHILYDENIFKSKKKSKINNIFPKWQFLISLPIVFVSFLYFVGPVVDDFIIIIAYGFDSYRDGLHFSNSKLGILSNGEELIKSLKSIRYIVDFISLLILIFFNLIIIHSFEWCTQHLLKKIRGKK